MTISEDACSDMYAVLGKLVKEKGAYPLIINGIGNHVHLLVDFGPYTARADLLKHIKHNSSYWAARCGKFPMWEGWGREYFCYSVSVDRRDTVISYIKRQKQHHLHRDYEQEMRHMVQNAGHEWHEQE